MSNSLAHFAATMTEFSELSADEKQRYSWIGKALCEYSAASRQSAGVSPEPFLMDVPLRDQELAERCFDVARLLLQVQAAYSAQNTDE